MGEKQDYESSPDYEMARLVNEDDEQIAMVWVPAWPNIPDVVRWADNRDYAYKSGPEDPGLVYVQLETPYVARTVRAYPPLNRKEKNDE